MDIKTAKRFVYAESQGQTSSRVLYSKNIDLPSSGTFSTSYFKNNLRAFILSAGSGNTFLLTKQNKPFVVLEKYTNQLINETPITLGSLRAQLSYVLSRAKLVGPVIVTSSKAPTVVLRDFSETKPTIAVQDPDSPSVAAIWFNGRLIGPQHVDLYNDLLSVITRVMRLPPNI